MNTAEQIKEKTNEIVQSVKESVQRVKESQQRVQTLKAQERAENKRADLTDTENKIAGEKLKQEKEETKFLKGYDIKVRDPKTGRTVTKHVKGWYDQQLARQAVDTTIAEVEANIRKNGGNPNDAFWRRQLDATQNAMWNVFHDKQEQYNGFEQLVAGAVAAGLGTFESFVDLLPMISAGKGSGYSSFSSGNSGSPVVNPDAMPPAPKSGTLLYNDKELQ